MDDLSASAGEQITEIRVALNDIYTPLEEAREEIWRRWNDPILKKKVEDFLQGDIPECLKSEPRAILGRHIATPTNEFIRFLDVSERIHLNPVVFEYTEDLFMGENPLKHNLGKLFFYDGIGKHGGVKVNARKIIDFDTAEKVPLSQVQTLHQESLIDVHHRLLDSSGLLQKLTLFDISAWCARNGGDAEYYYQKLLALALCHGVLFENFLASKGEGGFTQEVVLPSFEILQREFGLRPLITPLLPREKEEDLYFLCYPKYVEKFLLVQKNEPLA